MLNKIISTLPPLSPDEDERHQGRIEGIKAALLYPLSFTPVFFSVFLTSSIVTIAHYDLFLSTVSIFGTVLSITKLHYEGTSI